MEDATSLQLAPRRMQKCRSIFCFFPPIAKQRRTPKPTAAMAISSSGSNSIGSPFSPSSSSSSVSSLDSIPESRELTSEYDPTAVHEALTPLYWYAEEFDFGVVSKEDEPKTEGEDLRLLFQEESENIEEEDPSSDRVDSSSEEEIDSPSDEKNKNSDPNELVIPRGFALGKRD